MALSPSLAALKIRRAVQLRAELFRKARWERWHTTKNRAKRQEAHDLWVRAQRNRLIAEREIRRLSRRVVHVSNALVSFVADFEGGDKNGRFPPYQDEVGVWTIGYGHTAGDGAPIPHRGAPSLSRSEALALLKTDLAKLYEPSVRAAFRRAHVHPTQGQFDATVSFVFNCGVGMLDPSHDFGRLLRAGRTRAAAESLLEYDKGINGVTYPGLKRRREAERELFLK